MAGGDRPTTRRVYEYLDFSTADANGWVSVESPTMGKRGKITRCIVRALLAGGDVPANTIASIDLQVANGPYDPAAVGFDPATIPDEEIAYRETAITLATPATNAVDADFTRNVQFEVAGAVYCARQDGYRRIFDPANASERIQGVDEKIIVSAKNVAGVAANGIVKVTFYIDMGD
ncbi:MAG: hypothetical protein ACPG1A_15415 [Halioglobus sp.]